MSDIFLSYATEDRERVRPLSIALQALGWNVFWDVETPPGETWRHFIETQLQQARCFVVVWSTTSIDSEWVLEEADEAKAQKKNRLSVIIDDLEKLPFGHRGPQAASLVGWDGDTEDPRFRSLVTALETWLGEVPAKARQADSQAEVSQPAAAVRPLDSTGDTGANDRAAPEAPTQARSPDDKANPEARIPVVPGPDTESPARPRLPRISGLGSILGAFLGLATAVAVSFQVFQGQGLEMVVIPAGEFRMGDLAGSGDPREQPAHPVRVGPFALGRYEVTFEEFDAFARATQRRVPSDGGWGRGRRPVINVSWDEARAYAEWLSGQTGKRYRLPTEAEWEYAARAGTGTSRFWGEDESQACRYGNVYDKANKAVLARRYGFVGETHPCDDLYAETAPVDSNEFRPIPLGLSQILGNVWEWTEDCWHGNYEGAPGDGSAWLDGDGGDCAQRVVRGGSWVNTPWYVRSA